MKHIAKNREPADFTEWKRSQEPEPSWTSFEGTPEKRAVHQSLVDEQGCICCYCGARVERATSHIEHIKPRSLYPSLEFDYQNMLASCEGGTLDGLRRGETHCGHRKRYWYDEHLFVSPLDASCETYFRYLASGEISSTDDSGARPATEETIKRLGLNSASLQAARKNAIDAIVSVLAPGDHARATRLLHGFSQRDAGGRFAPFCMAIIYILQQF